MDTDLHEIGLRIRGLRDACDVSEEEMAEELEVSLDTYRAWEETGADVPISAIFHMAHEFGVDLTRSSPAPPPNWTPTTWCVAARAKRWSATPATATTTLPGATRTK